MTQASASAHIRVWERTAVYLNFFERFGGYYGGTLNEFRVQANFRLTPKFSISAAELGIDFDYRCPMVISGSAGRLAGTLLDRALAFLWNDPFYYLNTPGTTLLGPVDHCSFQSTNQMLPVRSPILKTIFINPLQNECRIVPPNSSNPSADSLRPPVRLSSPAFV